MSSEIPLVYNFGTRALDAKVHVIDIAEAMYDSTKPLTFCDMEVDESFSKKALLGIICRLANNPPVMVKKAAGL